MLPSHEALDVEFKSERTRLQSKDEIVDNVVALANTDGGTLYLGIEDDGTVTGVPAEHRNITGLAAMIFNSTMPPVSVRTELIEQDGKDVVAIEVPSSSQIVASSKGRILQRRLKADGSPEVVPLLPAEFISRLSQQHQYDYSAQPAPEAKYDDLDPRARQELRSAIRSTNASDPLLTLDDEEFDKALSLVSEVDGILRPTIAGLLMIGHPEAIRRSIPTASAVLQVMEGNRPRVNTDPLVLPLVSMFPELTRRFEPWNPAHEVMSGLLHVMVHDVDPTAFREAMVNAFCHRDYSQMGEVLFHLDETGLTITNPGGFISGIDQNNLLTAAPRSRNPCLAQILKTAGYAEHTGRGIDMIYAGSLFSGGSMPDYSGSSADQVTLFLRRTVPDEDFVVMITKEERRRGAPLSVWALIVLSLLKDRHRLTQSQLCEACPFPDARVIRTIEDLVESGLVEAQGDGRNRGYMLSPTFYQGAHGLMGYTRQHALDQTKQESLVTDYAKRNRGTITTREAQELLDLSYISAYRLLKKMVEDGKLRHEGSRSTSCYEVLPNHGIDLHGIDL